MTSFVDLQYLRLRRFGEQLVEEGKLYGNSPHMVVQPGSNQYITFTPGNGINSHLFLSFVATGSALVNVYTGTTFTNQGTIRANGAFNLTLPNQSTTIVREGVVPNVLGTKIADFLIPGGSGGNAVGGSVDQAQKVIIPAGLTLTIEIDNLSATDINFEPVFVWYEIGA